MHFEIQDINLLWTNPSVHCKLCCDWFNKADWLVARQGQVKRENQTKDTGTKRDRVGGVSHKPDTKENRMCGKSSNKS